VVKTASGTMYARPNSTRAVMLMDWRKRPLLAAGCAVAGGVVG